MAEIKINITNLEGAIARLNNMATNWASNDTTPPTTVGGGKTANELEALAQMYKELNNQMAELAANTASFFANIKSSYEESDHKAASNIKGK